MQNRRLLFAGLAGSLVAAPALAKPRPEADDAQQPSACPRCGRVHGKQQQDDK